MNPLKKLIKELQDRVEELENTVAIHESTDHDDTLKLVDSFCLECPTRDSDECYRCDLYPLVMKKGGVSG